MKNKVLIIGDGCLDVFRYGRCDRLCPEAPVPVLIPTKTTYNGGMAINVFENIKALGIKCDIVTNDIRPTKTRYIDEVSDQLILRVDENDKIKPISKKELNLIKFNTYIAIVISDYNKGFLSESDIKYICNENSLVFMDTKKELDDWCLNVKIIKINENEFNKNKKYLIDKYKNDLIVTKGKHGSILNHNEEFLIENIHDTRDLSGAGDTFFAALVADYIKNNDICRAIRFANKCASWVVTQKGVVVVDINKI